MSRLEMILSASLTLSVIFNIGILVYARAAIARLLSVSEELGDLQQMADSFTTHLQTVYDLEMFYGDQTLEHLLNHARSFREQMGTFEYIYELTVEEADIVDHDEEEEIAEGTQ